nr:hypothetical protein BaRGS_031068 [Batillaria attramentaria]
MELGRSLSKLVGDNNNNNNNNNNFARVSTTASGLSYRDVLVLTGDDPHDEETDVTGNVTRPASGAVTGLRRLGIPVRVVRNDDDEGVREVAEMAGGDVVTVTRYQTVWGLERKVVAVMGEAKGEEGDKLYARLLAMSRAVSQLIHVKAVR